MTESPRRPTTRQIESALDVLLWLHENSPENRPFRDKISDVRSRLHDIVDDITDERERRAQRARLRIR